MSQRAPFFLHLSERTRKNEELRFAIQKLEALTQPAASPLRRFVNLGRRLFTDSPEQTELREAVAIIKEHYLDQPQKMLVAETSPQLAPILPERPSLSSAPWLATEFTATAHEQDLFRAKAITLIRQHPFVSISLKDLFDTVRQAPVVQQEGEGQELVTFQQSLPLLPNYVILQGSFLRHERQKTVSVALPETFRLTYSVQTGHPLPMQHNGWAISEKALHLSKNSAEETQLSALLLKKRACAEQTAVARQLLKAKREAAREVRVEWLVLHAELAHALLKAGGKAGALVVSHYFDWLSHYQDPYEPLSHFYQKMNELFFSYPQAEVLAWLAGLTPHPARELMALMGPLFVAGAKQYETPFGRQFQRAIHVQLASFIEELCAPPSDEAGGERLLASLRRDIKIFT